METSVHSRPETLTTSDVPISVEVPPAFYSDTPLPPPPPHDPHWREWYDREPQRPSRPDPAGSISDRATMWWIMIVFGITIALHLVAFALLITMGHSG